MLRILIVLCLVLAGCEAGGERRPADRPGEQAAAPDTATLRTLDCAQLLDAGLAATPTRAGLREQFGEPDSVRAWTEPNRHIPDVLDSVFVVRYRGLTLELRKPAGGLDMADLAQVSDARFLAHRELGPGASAERVAAVLGTPAGRSAEELRYECGEVGAPVTFRLSGGIVREVLLDYYVD